VSSAARRMRDAVAAADEQVREQGYTVEPAVVDSVAAGGASDAHDLVTVRWRGALIAAPYSDHLTALAAGQVVLLTVPPHSPPFISHRLVGTP
jgi:septal ring factor EnvC (AmiA/AmiB activator)